MKLRDVIYWDGDLYTGTGFIARTPDDGDRGTLVIFFPWLYTSHQDHDEGAVILNEDDMKGTVKLEPTDRQKRYIATVERTISLPHLVIGRWFKIKEVVS